MEHRIYSISHDLEQLRCSIRNKIAPVLVPVVNQPKFCCVQHLIIAFFGFLGLILTLFLADLPRASKACLFLCSFSFLLVFVYIDHKKAHLVAVGEVWYAFGVFWGRLGFSIFLTPNGTPSPSISSAHPPYVLHGIGTSLLTHSCASRTQKVSGIAGEWTSGRINLLNFVSFVLTFVI